MADTRLDEVLLRFRASGPEFDGWLSNHGPMAGDALLRIDGGVDVEGWAAAYERRLEGSPDRRWRIGPEDWPEALGDPSRLGDWVAFFDERLREQTWREVLAAYWPTLVTGSLASATHGLIRTGHAVRSLAEDTTEPRVAELAQALGYWAARWVAFPGSGRVGARGTEQRPAEAEAGPDVIGPPDLRGHLERLARLEVDRPDGGIRTRLRGLDASPAWRREARAWLAADPPADVRAALLGLTDAAVTHYARHGAANPVMLVHAATAPRAAALVVPHLPDAAAASTWRWVGLASGTMAALYGTTPDGAQVPAEQDASDLAERVARHGDEHAVKLVEVALESAGRGNPAAAAAGETAVRLVAPLEGWGERV